MIIPDPSALQELVQQLHRQATPWLPAGLGSRLHWGPPVQPGPGREAPLVVSTARLDRILEHCVGDFTVTVQAGVPLQQLQQELAASGQRNRCLWGWPGTALLDSDMAPLDLSADGLALLQAIDSRPAGTPLGALPLAWDPARIAAVARTLQRQQVLLLRPAPDKAS